MDSSRFLRWEAVSRDTLDFKKIYVDMAGDLAAGLLLSQIVYWHLPDRDGKAKMRVQRDGHHWIAKQWNQWWAEVRLTEKQAIRAGEILVSQGIVIKQVYKFAGDRTTHLRLDWDVFLSLWDETSKKPEEERNAEPGTRTKRPDLPRRPKAKDGEGKSRSKSKMREGDLQNAEKEFSKTPKRGFAKHPKGATENTQRGRPITESTTQTSSETLQRSGVRHVIENARADTPPAAPVDEQGPLAHTTFEASLSQDLKALREPRARVAVLPPDSGAADAAVMNSELEFLFGADVEDPQETEEVKSEGKVPGGAAALLVPPAGRGNALRPVDRNELLERPIAVPSDTTYRLVKGLIGGNKAIDDGILDTLTPAGALSRRDWLRLTEEELTEARRVAQAEAQVEKLNFYTCAIRALDVLIGAPVGQIGQRGAAAAVVANAGCHAAAPHFEEADRSGDVGKFDEGAGWIRKGDREAVTIERTEVVKRRNTEGLVYHLSDGRTCNALQLMTGYEFQEVGA